MSRRGVGSLPFIAVRVAVRPQRERGERAEIRRIWIGAIALGALLAVTPAAQADTTGSISGATINSQGSRVSVSNLQVHFDSCGGFDSITGLRGCGAIGSVVAASRTCPAGAAGIKELWDTDDAYRPVAGEVTLNSGAVSTAVSEPVAYRVCLYSYVFSQNFGMATPILRSEALTPAPPQLTKGKAVDATNAALKNRYGKKFKKGKRKNINCVKQEPRRFSCKVKWIYGNRSYKGKVIVSGSPSSPSTRINVSSKRRG